MADDKELKRTPLAAMREAWFALTGVVSAAEAEVQKRFYESLGLQPDANLGAELLTKVRKNREEFERRIDEGVKAAVAKVRAPIDKEIASLKERVEKLQHKVEEQRTRRSEAKDAKDAKEPKDKK
jgi:hypothetical protein